MGGWRVEEREETIGTAVVAACIDCGATYKTSIRKPWILAMRKKGWRHRCIPSGLGTVTFNNGTKDEEFAPGETVTLMRWVSVCPEHVQEGDW
jgi:hypothetical protein